MNALVEVAPISVTPAQAQEWLDNNFFHKQRKRRLAHAQFLASEMAAGRFRRGTVIEFGVLNGVLHLVNGQHTLAAVVLHGAPVELIVVKQPVADEEALGRLYNTHDSGLTRTWTDAYAALDLSGRFKMTDTEVNAFGRAAPYIIGGFGYRCVLEAVKSRSKEGRIGTMEAYHQAARAYLDCLSVAEPYIRRALMVAPIFALGTYTMFHDQERAARFWTLAADDQNLSKSDPPKVVTVLAQRLERRTEKALIGLGQSVALVWNRFAKGQDVRTVRLVRTPTDTARVLCTPLSDPELDLEAVTPEQEDAFERARDAFGEDAPSVMGVARDRGQGEASHAGA
jgi:hypothetical protein